ncbi:hypothetical protein JTB14_019215 [Gonioctena quinquepunctata]|nr:hypothetical protein JTB14_019215 [Gonioctena quinquepunctata]
MKEVLLRDGNITLEKVSEYSRAVEVSKQQIEEFQREASVNINVVKRKSVKRDIIDDCNFCGYSHRIRNCPVFGKECGFCKKKGHFVKKCLEFLKNKKNILEIQEDESEPYDHYCMEYPNKHNSIDLYEGVNTEKVRRKLIKNQHVQKCYYDKKGVKNLPKVKEGDEIIIRKDGIWEPGTVIGEHQSPRSYIVEDDSGKILRRNRKLLKTSSSDFSKPSDESSEGSGRSEGRAAKGGRKTTRQKKTGKRQSQLNQPTQNRTTIPPIILEGKPMMERNGHTELRGLCTKKVTIRYTQDNTLNAECMEDFNEIKERIKSRNIGFHAYTHKSEKQHAFVLKGMDNGPTTKDITEWLTKELLNL